MATNISGVPELLAKLKGLSIEGSRMASAIVQSTADLIVAEAKQSAPADLGQIRQGIGKNTVNGTGRMQVEVFANAPHSAYMEFGTGPLVDVPEDMTEMAAQFQGVSNGNFADFITALTDWVKRHGAAYGTAYSIKTHKRVGNKQANTDADTQAAWAIARFILKNGLKPHPFLYPAWLKFSTQMPDKLKIALKSVSSILTRGHFKVNYIWPIF